MSSENQQYIDGFQSNDSANQNDNSNKGPSVTIGCPHTSSSSLAVGVAVTANAESELSATLERTRTEKLQLELALKKKEKQIELLELKVLLERSRAEVQQFELEIVKKEHELKQLEFTVDKLYKGKLSENTEKYNEKVEENQKLLADRHSIASQLEHIAKRLKVGTFSNGSGHQSNSNNTVATIAKIKLNALPDVPMVKLISKLPLQDLLQMARVCSKWKTYQAINASKVKSITLLIGKPVPIDISNEFIQTSHLAKLVNDDGTPMYPKCQLNEERYNVRYSMLRTDTVRFLVETLPNIVNLQIIVYGVSYEVYDQVIELIRMWSSKLIKLKLWCSTLCEANDATNGSAQKDKAMQLLNSINSSELLPSLKHLIVKFRDALYPTTDGNAAQVMNDQFMGPQPHFEMPILSRLHEFHFESMDEIEQIPLYYSLKQYVPSNPHLTRIGIGNEHRNCLYLDFAEQCPDVASRITSLNDLVWSDHMDLPEDPMAAQPIFEQFSSLTEVSFRNLDIKFSQLINSLSTLNQLVRLYLMMHFVDFDPRCVVYHLSEDDQIERSQIRQLSSVKLLSIYVVTNNQSDLDSEHWGWAFPNVQILELETDPTDDLSRPVPGVHQMVPTFLKCPKLRLIFIFDRVWQEWTVTKTDGQTTVRQV